jgi:PhnB protein
MRLTPHLHFNGQCAEAFRYYEKHLGAAITFQMTYGESPAADDWPALWSDLILHATLRLGAQTITGADGIGEHYHKPQGFALTLAPDTIAETERVFAALAEGGKVDLPLEKTFWADRFGMLADRFGIPWMINCTVPE